MGTLLIRDVILGLSKGNNVNYKISPYAF